MNLRKEAYNEESMTHSVRSAGSAMLDGREYQNQMVFTDDLETELEKDLAGLSANERKQIADEIQGVAKKMEYDSEDAMAVESLLASFDDEISKVRGPVRVGFDTAVKVSAAYVESRKFRLAFLRAAQFDVRKASLRMLKHFQYKLELFGEGKITKDITFEDLSEADRACLHRGAAQFLGTKDAFGRTVAFFFPGIVEYGSWQNYVRTIWYLAMVSIEDETTQKGGIVVVSIGNPNRNLCSLIGKFHMLENGLPTRLVAMHVCLSEKSFNPTVRQVLLALGKQFRQRYRIHRRAPLDAPERLPSSLPAFGINLETIPLTEEGSPKTTQFLQVIQERARREKNIQHKTPNAKGSDSTLRPISHQKITPTEKDALMGRGQKYRSHSGNIILERMIETELPSFRRASSSFEKTCIVLGIVQHFRETGGRFLSRDRKTNEWMLARDPAIHDAVGGRCRFGIQKLKPKAAFEAVATFQAPSMDSKTSKNDHQHQEQDQQKQIQDLQEQLRTQQQMQQELKREEQLLRLQLQVEQNIRTQLQRNQILLEQLQQNYQQQTRQGPGFRRYFGFSGP